MTAKAPKKPVPADAPLDRPKRPCSACGRMFQPTRRRRMLCAGCFIGGADSPFAP